MPYRWCVSTRWAQCTALEDLKLEEDPNFAIFKLDIPDADFKPQSFITFAQYDN